MVTCIYTLKTCVDWLTQHNTYYILTLRCMMFHFKGYLYTYYRYSNLYSLHFLYSSITPRFLFLLNPFNPFYFNSRTSIIFISYSYSHASIYNTYILYTVEEYELTILITAFITAFITVFFTVFIYYISCL